MIYNGEINIDRFFIYCHDVVCFKGNQCENCMFSYAKRYSIKELVELAQKEYERECNNEL